MRHACLAILLGGLVLQVSGLAMAEGGISALLSGSERIAIVRLESVGAPEWGKPTVRATATVLHTLKGRETTGALNLLLPAAPHANSPTIPAGRDYLVFLNRPDSFGDLTINGATAIARIDSAFVEPSTENTEHDVLQLLHHSLDSSDPEIQAY